MHDGLRVLLVFGVTIAIIVAALRWNKEYKKFNTPVFFINLERRPDRLKHSRNVLSPHFRRVERVEAVDGRKVDPLDVQHLIHPFYDTEENQRWDKSITWFRNHRLSAGEIGCCLSHRYLWEKLQRETHGDPVLVCEDDLLLHPKFKTRYAKLLKELPDEWDVLYLGYIDVGGLGEYVSENIRVNDFVFGSFCYMLSQTGIEKLVKHLPIDRPIDNFLGHLMETRILKGFAVYPPIADQIEYGGYGSDIDHSAHSL